MLESPLAERVVGRAVSGPLVDATAREMAGHAVVERVAEQLLRAGVADRLAHERTVGQVIESRLLDHVVPVRDVHASPVTTGHNRCERCQPGAIPSVAPGPPSATPGDKTTAREIRSRRKAPHTFAPTVL